METLDSFLEATFTIESTEVEPGSSTDPDPGEPKHTSTPHKKPHLCGTFGKTYRRATALSEHARLVHGAGAGARYLCKECGKGFMSEAYFDSHTNTHEQKAPHSCPTCGKHFKNKTCLKRHAKVCEGGAEQPSFNCTVCKKSFSFKKNLTQHMHTHDERSQFRCLKCFIAPPFIVTQSHVLFHEQLIEN